MTVLCRFCHAHTKCMIVGHLYIEKGPCVRCGKDVECVNCKAPDFAREKMVEVYRNTKPLKEYGGGFL